MRYLNDEMKTEPETDQSVLLRVADKQKLVRQIRRDCILKLLILTVLVSLAWMILPASGRTVLAASNIPVEVEIPVKYIAGEGSEGVEEHISLTPDLPSNPMPKGTQNGRRQITLKGSAETTFGAITYSSPGKYDYTVEAESDPAVFHVQTVVTSDSQGSMIVTKEGEQGKSGIVFHAAGTVSEEPAGENETDPDRDSDAASGSVTGTAPTGDRMPVILWITLGVLSLLCLAWLLAEETGLLSGIRRRLRSRGTGLCVILLCGSLLGSGLMTTGPEPAFGLYDTTGGIVLSGQVSEGEERVPDEAKFINEGKEPALRGETAEDTEDAGKTTEGNPKSGTRSAERRHDLIMWTNVTGDLGDLTKRFCFEISFTGLESEYVYDVLADETILDPTSAAGQLLQAKGFDISAAVVQTVTADAAGKATATVSLGDDQGVTLPGLPEGATYRITEMASDHIATFRQESIGQEGMETVGQPFFIKASGTNGSTSNASLRTAKETFDTGDGTVLVAWENARNLAPCTGVSGNRWAWLSALIGLLGCVGAWFVAAGKSTTPQSPADLGRSEASAAPACYGE